MRLPETKIKPLEFKDELGKPTNIYLSTISGLLYVVFLFSALVGIVGIALTIALIKNYEQDLILYAIIGAPMIALPIYIYLGSRFRYIATFNYGFVVKRRFKYKKIKYTELEKVELRNLSIFYNILRRDFRKELAIDFILKNGEFFSVGESYRIFKFIPYPRLPSGLRVLDIKNLYSEIKNKIKRRVGKGEFHP